PAGRRRTRAAPRERRGSSARAPGCASLRRSPCARVRWSFSVREADRLAADRIVLAQRVAFPVVLEQDPHEIRMAVEADAHQVELLALVPVGGRPHAYDARHGLAVIEPRLQAHARRALA